MYLFDNISQSIRYTNCVQCFVAWAPLLRVCRSKLLSFNVIKTKLCFVEDVEKANDVEVSRKLPQDIYFKMFQEEFSFQ